MSLVAIVLPHREAFAPDAAGAIGLLVHRQAVAPSRFERIVVGRPVPAPFADAAFHAAPQAWLPAPLARRYGAGVARALRRLRPALIEVHNRPDLALALARLGAPVTLVLHNDPLGMRGLRTQERWRALAVRVARIVCVSAWLRDRLGLAEAIVLPNCIDLSAIPPSPPDRVRKILFAGRVVADKGADAFVDACARALPRLPGWRAEIIGADRFGAHSPDTPFLRALRPRAAAAGVTLSGWQPHEAVLRAMAGAAIVVVPSRWAEPFGMTALEAAACGAALAVSDRGGLPEIVGDAALRIDPDDPEAMAGALAALATDPPRMAAMGRAVRDRAALFDVGPLMVKLDALRAEALATWPRRGGDPI